MNSKPLISLVALALLSPVLHAENRLDSIGAASTDGGGDAIRSPVEADAMAVTGRWGTERDAGYGQAPHKHTGVDLGAPCGTPAFAAVSGTVTKVNPYKYVIGTTFEITSADGRYRTVYKHMMASYVAEGDSVTQGQFVGLTGKSGAYIDDETLGFEEYGCHLHFEIFDAGENVDPMNYIAGKPATPPQVDSWVVLDPEHRVTEPLADDELCYTLQGSLSKIKPCERETKTQPVNDNLSPLNPWQP